MKAGWKTVKLGEVLDKTENIDPTDFPEKEYDYIDVSSVSNKSFSIEETQRINGKDAPSRARKLVRKNDVIFATIRPTLQRIAIIPEPLDGQICSTGYFVLRPKEIISSRFIYYALMTDSFRSQMELLQKGASYPAVTDGDVRNQLIPLPPLVEQKRIVALLDEAFAGIDQAKAKAQASVQSLGTLVVSEFQSLVDEKGFERKRLPELASHTLGKMLDKKKNTGTPRPYLRNVNVRWFEFDLSDIHEMPIRDEEAARCQARKGDVLMCEGGYPGRCAIWRSDEPVFFQKALHRIRFNEKWMAEWFVNYMHSLDSSGKISEFFTGTGIQHLTGETLSKLEIPVPPKSEIEAYVKKISAIRNETNDLAANESAKLDALSELKTSLLAQAFAGELTA